MSLKGRRIAILAERQYEDLELWYPRLRLQEEHAEVVVAGPGGGTFLSKHGYPVEADVDISNLSADVLHGIIVPGGWAPDYPRRNVLSEVDGELFSVQLTTEALQYMVDILNRLPSMKSYRGTEFDPDTHDALTVIRDFASGSDPKGSLEAESIVILDVVLQENGYAVRGNTRLRKVLEYAEVPGLTRNPQ